MKENSSRISGGELLTDYYNHEFLDPSQMERDLGMLPSKERHWSIFNSIKNTANAIDERLSQLLQVPLQTGEMTANYYTHEFSQSNQQERDCAELMPVSESFLKKIKSTELKFIEYDFIDVHPSDIFSYTLDQEICGTTQVSAMTCLALGASKEMTDKLVAHRILAASGTALSLLGNYLNNWGISTKSPSHLIGMGGILLDAGSSILESHYRNENSKDLYDFFDKKMQSLIPYNTYLIDYLVQAGTSNRNILAVNTIGRSIAQAEIDSVHMETFENVAGPLVASGDMVAYGENGYALGILIASFSSFPFGELVYKKLFKPNGEKSRLAKSAGVESEIKRFNKTHVKITDTTNSVYQVKKILKALLYAVPNNFGNLAANVASIDTSFNGFTGLLSNQQTKITNEEVIMTANTLASFYNSPHYLINPKRFEKHCKQPSMQIPENESFTNGIRIYNFTPILPNGRPTELRGISEDIKPGEIRLWTGASGKGKSYLLSSIAHTSNHTGEVEFIKNGEKTNIHSLTKEEIKRKVLIVDSTVIPGNSRLVDQIKDEYNSQIAKIHPVFDTEQELLEWETGINVEDILLERELSKEDPEEFRFSVAVREKLKDFRDKRNIFFKQILMFGRGNLESLTPDRTYGTLSAGQKKRYAVLQALVKILSNPEYKLVIFDEPFSGLDEEVNFIEQMNIIAQIREIDNPPAIAIVTQEFINQAANRFGSKEFNLYLKKYVPRGSTNEEN